MNPESGLAGDPGPLGIYSDEARRISDTITLHLLADGYALAMHAPGLAEALNETAKQQPSVARALESIMKAGPYGAIIGAMVPLVMQLAANHGLMKPLPQMGIHDPADLAAAADEQMVAMAGAAVS